MRSPLSLLLRIRSTLTALQARWSYPRNHYYLCYASLLALLLCQCYDAYHLLSSLPNCHVKPLTHHVLANRWLAMLPLCSAPLIALLVAGEDWSLFLVGTWRCCSLLEHVYLLGYHNISYLINASIYLVKGGRLGDEDINTIVTPTAPTATYTGPITRARARQLNYQVLSWWGHDYLGYDQKYCIYAYLSGDF